jgi:hypothetical protein
VRGNACIVSRRSAALGRERGVRTTVARDGLAVEL